MTIHNDPLLERVKYLAGPLRHESFVLAAEMILERRWHFMIETGCFRGIPADGESTLIFALLARRNGAHFVSYELDRAHVEEAQKHLKIAVPAISDIGDWVSFSVGDSVAALAKRDIPINFAYLDSWDFEADNPAPSQEHQLKEAKTILPLMCPRAAILCDDCALPHGGKNGLSGPYLEANGWKCVYQGYQRLYVNF